MVSVDCGSGHYVCSVSCQHVTGKVKYEIQLITEANKNMTTTGAPYISSVVVKAINDWQMSPKGTRLLTISYLITTCIPTRGLGLFITLRSL